MKISIFLIPSSIAFFNIKLLSVFHNAITGWLKPLDFATTKSTFGFSFLAFTRDSIKFFGRKGVSQGKVRTQFCFIFFAQFREAKMPTNGP